MTLRRYAPIAPSKGTVTPTSMRLDVLLRDMGCVGFKVGFPTSCAGALEVDHVRASHGIGMKSRTEPDNLVALCGTCHRWKTANGRVARPLLLAYLEAIEDPHASHVDPVAGCPKCFWPIDFERGE